MSIFHWLLLSGETNLLLPHDQPSLPNLWIRMPESASLFMTSLLCPDPQVKPFPRILSPDSVLPASSPFLSPDHCPLLSHRVCQPDSQCDVALLPPDNHTEEPKFSFLIPSQILKRRSCAYHLWFPAECLPERSTNLLNLTVVSG
ncbi:hypothetical protein CHARACLAT_025908 [Characodon lateralis]|uniref:Uncharacterized protein n=1 Tax=Characodon lateralis TaxID=208331 RepID=A0ABU7E3U6_9TELE|nr:hypothetical protein [Characodon lateralis]